MVCLDYHIFTGYPLHLQSFRPKIQFVYSIPLAQRQIRSETTLESILKSHYHLGRGRARASTSVCLHDDICCRFHDNHSPQTLMTLTSPVAHSD